MITPSSTTDRDAPLKVLGALLMSVTLCATPRVLAVEKGKGCGASEPADKIITEGVAVTETNWTRRSWAVEGLGGYSAGQLVAGAAADWSPSTGASLHLAAIFGRTGEAGIDGTVRIRVFTFSSIAFGAEGGFVVLPYEHAERCSPRGCQTWYWEHSAWGKVGVHSEVRTANGLSLRLSAGASAIFNVDEGKCRGCQAGQTPALWTASQPYVGATFGWAFGL